MYGIPPGMALTKPQVRALSAVLFGHDPYEVVTPRVVAALIEKEAIIATTDGLVITQRGCLLYMNRRTYGHVTGVTQPRI